MITPLFTKLARYSLARAFVSHAGKIGSLASLSSDSLYSANRSLLKGGFVLDLMTMSGLLYLSSSSVMFGMDRFPFLKRVSGAAALGGFALLFADAHNKPGFEQLVIGSALPLAVCTAMVFERTDPHKKGQMNILQRALYRFTQSPVFWLSMASMMTKPFQAYYGQQNGETFFNIAIALAALENFATAFTDNSIRRIFRMEITRDQPAPPGQSL